MNESVNYCPSCGSVIFPSYKFCGNCGYQLHFEMESFKVGNDEQRSFSPDDWKNNSNSQYEQVEEKKAVPYYRYARFVTNKDGFLRFRSPDGAYFCVPEKYADQMGDLSEDRFCWLWIVPKEGGKTWAYPALPDDSHMYAEFVSFAATHREGDQIVLPVKGLNSMNCMVMIGPTSYVNIPRNEIDKTYKSSEIKPNRDYFFTINRISKENYKYTFDLELSGSVRSAKEKDLYTLIPESISDICCPPTIIDYIVDDPNKREKIAQVIGAINAANLIKHIEKEYQKQKSNKTLIVLSRKKGIFIDIDLGIKDENGVPMRACVNKKKGRDKFVLSLVGGTSPTTEMERFVYIPDWKKFCEEAAILALHERWDYDESESYSILSSYLKMTYYKARLDGLIVENEDGAVFNTGLVDSSYDEIFCFLERAKSIDDPFERDWTLGFFACRGKGVYGKKLNKLFGSFPPAPTYIDPKHIECIFFDTDKDLFCDYSHIIQDNLNRLPSAFISQTLAYDPEVRAWSSRNESVEQIKKYVLSRPDLFKGLEDQLKSAVETAKKHCKWNYKTAIPIYYPRTNNISLLLPLTVVKGSNTVDTALVVQMLPNGNYQGQTILTLEMAYKDARQICRPNSEWLTLETVRDSVRTDDDDLPD